MNSRHITAVMRELEWQRHQTVFLVGQSLDTGAVTADRESWTGRYEVVRRKLMAVGDRQPKDVLPRPQWHPGKAALDRARSADAGRHVAGTRRRSRDDQPGIDVDDSHLKYRPHDRLLRAVRRADDERVTSSKQHAGTAGRIDDLYAGVPDLSGSAAMT